MRAIILTSFVIFFSLNGISGDKNPPTEMSLIYISVDRQKLYVLYNNEIIKEFDVSTSKYGTGTKRNSNKTPLGLHLIASKVGDGQPINTIYKSRINTKRLAIPNQARFVNDDLITTRIMWLEGGEEKNSLGANSSFKRYIYIHGTPDEMGLGYTASHGCVRMRNTDILGLYEYVDLGTPVILWQNDESYNKVMSKGLRKEKKRNKRLARKRGGYQNLRINY